MSDLARWEERFSSPDYVFGIEPNAFLKKQAARLSRGQRALSLADGEGRNGVWLAMQGLDVLSVDFSPKALAKAEALARKHGVVIRTERADLSAWRWPENTFDVVVGIFMFQAVAQLNLKDLQEIAPAFIIIVATPLTFSIAEGIGLGLVAYTVIHFLTGRRREISWLVYLLSAIFAMHLFGRLTGN